MPGSKKRHKQGDWDEMVMKRAVHVVLVNGLSQKKAASQYAVPRQTLRRYLEKVKTGDGGVEKKLGRKTTLTVEQENELSALLQNMESKLYGLTPMDVRRIVFDFCKKNNIANCFNVNKEIAGRKWLKLFMKRHQELSVRSPEPTSIQRAQGFNRSKVEHFFNVLKSTVCDENGSVVIPAENVYNADGSGFSVCHKPKKIIAKRGKRGVGALTSAERGRNITVLCCMSAAGHFVPPFFLFPRANMKASLLDNAPPGSIGKANRTGWMTEEMFTVWFDHFVSVVQPKSRPQPVVLLVDGHYSHTRNVEVLEAAKANNVVILVFPSHSTHRLQPCDVSFFKSLKSTYDDKAQTWLRNHPGRAITEAEMMSIFAEAYGRAANVANAVSGFQKTGIHPFDPSKIEEMDFSAASVTDNDLSESLPPTEAGSTVATMLDTDQVRLLGEK